MNQSLPRRHWKKASCTSSNSRCSRLGNPSPPSPKPSSCSSSSPSSSSPSASPCSCSPLTSSNTPSDMIMYAQPTTPPALLTSPWGQRWLVLCLCIISYITSIRITGYMQTLSARISSKEKVSAVVMLKMPAPQSCTTEICTLMFRLPEQHWIRMLWLTLVG